jgi:hypothetical protein
MNFSRPAAVVLIVSFVVLAACERPDSDSERSSEHETRSESVATQVQTRAVENFHSIEMRGAAELVVKIGPATSLNLEGSEKTLNRVDTRVNDDSLVIDVGKSHGWFSEYGHLKVTITTPSLKALESNGAGDIKITGLNGGDQELRLAGAHNVEGDGHLDKLTIVLSGAGNIDYHKVVAEDATVTVNGAGNVDVQVKQALHAEVNGLGAVHYSGEPQKVESELHGLGSISRR